MTPLARSIITKHLLALARESYLLADNAELFGDVVHCEPTNFRALSDVLDLLDILPDDDLPMVGPGPALAQMHLLPHDHEWRKGDNDEPLYFCNSCEAWHADISPLGARGIVVCEDCAKKLTPLETLLLEIGNTEVKS